MGLMGVLLVLSIAVSTYIEARRQGVWSWPRFLLTIVCLSVLGGGTGLLAVRLGHGAGQRFALPIALAAALVIILAVFALSLRIRAKRTGG